MASAFFYLKFGPIGRLGLFKDARPYLFSSAVDLPLLEFQKLLEKHQFTGPSKAAVSSGFISPRRHLSALEGAQHEIAYELMGKVLFSYCIAERKINKSELRSEIAERVAVYEKRHGHCYKSEKKSIAKSVEEDLLSNAFPTETVIYGYIDRMSGLLVICCGSEARAEKVTSALRHALGGLGVVSPSFSSSPADVMTDWLRANPQFSIPDGVGISGPVKMEVSEEVAVFSDVSGGLSSAVEEAIDSGFKVSQARLVFSGSHSCKFDVYGAMTSIKLSDGTKLELADSRESSGDDPLAAFDATFLIMTDKVGAAWKKIVEAFDGYIDAPVTW